MIISCLGGGGAVLKLLPVIQQNVWLPDVSAVKPHRVYARIFWHIPFEVTIHPLLWKTQTCHLKPNSFLRMFKNCTYLHDVVHYYQRNRKKMESRTNNNPEKTPKVNFWKYLEKCIFYNNNNNKIIQFQSVLISFLKSYKNLHKKHPSSPKDRRITY